MDPQLQLEVFVLHAYDTTLQIRGGGVPRRCLLFKLDGQPAQKLPLDAAQVSFAPLGGPEAELGGAVQFEPLLTVRATRRWLLGTQPCSPHLQLHVLLATDGDGSSSSSSNSGPNSCSTSVVGVGQLALPLLGALPLGALPLGTLPIQHEALQDCQLSCPSTGARVGCVSLAARLTAAPAAASPPTAQAPAQAAGTHGCHSSGGIDAVVTVQCGGPCACGPEAAAAAAAAAGGHRAPSKRHAAAQASPTKPATAPAAGPPQPLMCYASLPLAPCYLPMPMAPLYFPAPMQSFPGYPCYPAQQAAVQPSPWPANSSSSSAMAAAPGIATGVPANPCCHPATPQSQPPPLQQPCFGRDCSCQAPPMDTSLTSGSRRPETPACPQPGHMRSSSGSTPRRLSEGGSRPPGEVLLRSPLKPHPTPLVLEHRLQELPHSRSPAQRHAGMVKSALRDSHAFFCPGCLKPFMRLPHSPSKAAVQDALLCSDCKHCRAALLPRAAAGAGAAAADSKAGASGANTSGGRQHGCSQVAQGACSEAVARVAAKVAEKCSNRWSVSGGCQAGQGQRQLPGSDAAASSSAMLPSGCSTMQPAPAFAEAAPSGCPSGAQPAAAAAAAAAGVMPPDAAAFAQLLASLNLSGDWQARLLQSIGAPTSSAGLAFGSQVPVPAAAGAAGAAGGHAGASAPGQLSAEVPLNVVCSSGGSECGQSGQKGSKSSNPRRHWVPAGPAGGDSSEGPLPPPPVLTASAGGGSRRSTAGGKVGTQQMAKQHTGLYAASPRIAGRAQGMHAAVSAAGGQPGDVSAERKNAPTGQRQPEVCFPLGSRSRGSKAWDGPRKSDTATDIISRNRQLLQQLQGSSGGGREPAAGTAAAPAQDSAVGSIPGSASTDYDERSSWEASLVSGAGEPSSLQAAAGPSSETNGQGYLVSYTSTDELACGHSDGGHQAGPASSEEQTCAGGGRKVAAAACAEEEEQSGGESAEDIVSRLQCRREWSQGLSSADSTIRLSSEDLGSSGRPAAASCGGGVAESGKAGGGTVGPLAAIDNSEVGSLAAGEWQAAGGQVGIVGGDSELDAASEQYEDDFEADSEAE